MRKQAKLVLDYMKGAGGITSLEAFRDLGITRLSAVIFDLKAAGVPIAKETVTSTNRYGDKSRYARYYLLR